MELRIQKSDFLKGLRIAQSIADRKSTMPILANVLLRTEGKNRLFLSATNLNVSLSAELPAKIEKEGGLTVGAKSLHEVVANLPGEDIVIKRAENNWAELRAGKVQYKLVGMADRDFPRIPDPRSATFSEIDPAVLMEMIDKTLFAVSTDENRFHLNGVLFESDGVVARMVATDGHRLAKIERTMTGAPVLQSGIIVPRKGLTEIGKITDSATGPCEIAVAGNHLFVRRGGLSLAVKLIEAQFPPYQQVIPKTNDKVIVIERVALLEALKRASLMSSDTRGVRITANQGVLQVASDNPELGEAREELAVGYAGDEISIGFNPRYMIDFLDQMTVEQVRVELSGELDPAVIRPCETADYVGVVMPMRI